MDEEKPETSSSSPDVNKERVLPKELKCSKPCNNILIYLIGRQLGKPADKDFFQRVWTRA